MNKAIWEVDSCEDNNYVIKIKKDKSKIEKEINKISKEIFQSFCDSLKGSQFEEDAIEFSKGKPPVVSSFEMNCDYIDIQLKYFSGCEDIHLFFQEYLINELNNDTILKSLGYYFMGEDYLAIYIYLEEDSI